MRSTSGLAAALGGAGLAPAPQAHVSSTSRAARLRRPIICRRWYQARPEPPPAAATVSGTVLSLGWPQLLDRLLHERQIDVLVQVEFGRGLASSQEVIQIVLDGLHVRDRVGLQA